MILLLKYYQKNNSPYMKNEHIINAWLFDNINGDRIPVKIINIKQEKINKYYKYKIFIDNTLYHDSEILMFNANLKIEYINNKILDIPLGNVNLIKITEDYD